MVVFEKRRKRLKSKILKINENSRFRCIYSRGRFVSGYNLTTYCLKNYSHVVKIGITTSKKIGCAVRRNRARRLIFEAYRKISCEILPGYDLVFLARAKTCDENMDRVFKSMIYQTKKLGLWKNFPQGYKNK